MASQVGGCGPGTCKISRGDLAPQLLDVRPGLVELAARQHRGDGKPDAGQQDQAPGDRHCQPESAASTPATAGNPDPSLANRCRCVVQPQKRTTAIHGPIGAFECVSEFD